MTTEEILNLDYRKDESKDKIQKVLRKIKPLSKYSEEDDIPLIVLEKLILLYQKKYNIRFSYIMMNTESIMIYTASLRTEKGEWIGNVYGAYIYELFAKVCVLMFAKAKKGEIERKDNK